MGNLRWVDKKGQDEKIERSEKMNRIEEIKK